MKSETSPFRVLVKALGLFVVINILYALINPPGVQVSVYNVIFPGRTRFPFGVGDPFSVTVEDVDIMFASHAISARKEPNEYRVVMIGDSSLWGEDVTAYDVISEQWNKLNSPCGDKIVRAYDLGYPHPSVVKDLVILDKATEYEPDLIVWFVTLNTLISQRINPFLVANRDRVAHLLDVYDIAFEQAEKFETGSTFYERTLIGQRSNLARRIKLELLGIIWAATDQDTHTLAVSSPPDSGVSDDPRYRGMAPPQNIEDLLLFDALMAGHAIANKVPVLMVNEPIFIAAEDRASVRYNAVYPRWVYDQYREHLAKQAQISQWKYLDLWNAVPSGYFADARFHLSAEGERLLVGQIDPVVRSVVCTANH